MGIIFESKRRRRTRHRIEDLVTAHGKTPTVDEVIYEFRMRLIKSPPRGVIEEILVGIEVGWVFYKTLDEISLGREKLRLKEESDGYGGLQWIKTYI